MDFNIPDICAFACPLLLCTLLSFQVRETIKSVHIEKSLIKQRKEKKEASFTQIVFYNRFAYVKFEKKTTDIKLKNGKPQCVKLVISKPCNTLVLCYLELNAF